MPARLEGQSDSPEVPLINISTTGLQISAGQAVESGLPLYVEVMPGEILTATIRWSRQDGEDFLVGAEWSEPISFEQVWRIRSG